MDIEFEYENNNNYMIFNLDEYNYEDYQLKMICESNYPEFLPVSSRFINNRSYFYYNITSKQKMSALYRIKRIQWDEVKSLCLYIKNMVELTKELLLDITDVVLDPEYIYINVTDKNYEFAYCPGLKNDFYKSLQMLFEFVLEHIDHNQEKNNVLSIYGIYEKIIHGELDVNKILCVNSNKEENSESQSIPSNNKLSSQDDIPVNKMSKEANNEAIKDKSKINIKDVLQEEIIEDVEQKDMSYAYKWWSIFICSVLMLLIGIVELFFVNLAFFQLDLRISVILVVVGSVLFYIALNKIKRNKDITKINYKVNHQDYIIKENEIAQPVNTTQPINNVEVKDCKMENKRDMQADSLTRQGMENTVLLSDYIREGYAKEKSLYLRKKKMESDNLEETKTNSYKKQNVDSEDEIIHVKDFPCIVGSLAGYCNIMLENELVSRMHLCIRKQSDGWFIEDMNSTNGTYINSLRIKPNQQHRLEDKDELSIATIPYIVEIR